MNGLIFQNMSQNWLKFKKIWTNQATFFQNWAQNWTNWNMNGSLFPEKLVFVLVYFQILQQHTPKTELEYPPDPHSYSNVVVATAMWRMRALLAGQRNSDVFNTATKSKKFIVNYLWCNILFFSACEDNTVRCSICETKCSGIYLILLYHSNLFLDIYLYHYLANMNENWGK